MFASEVVGGTDAVGLFEVAQNSPARDKYYWVILNVLNLIKN